MRLTNKIRSYSWKSSNLHHYFVAGFIAYMITEWLNGLGWMGLFEVIWSNPSAQTEPPRAGCSGPFPEPSVMRTLQVLSCKTSSSKFCFEALDCSFSFFSLSVIIINFGLWWYPFICQHTAVLFSVHSTHWWN